MGSNFETDLILAQPTPAERLRVWTATHQKWGAALELDAYLRREEFLTTVPMSRNGGITHWILTDPSKPPDARPILSSCESIRKRALAARPDHHGGGFTLVETVAHGIASVFTEPQYRGRGYASAMMGMLGPRLGDWQGGKVAATASDENKTNSQKVIKDGDVAFSVLFSDIGKKFYAKQGWHPYESTHLSIPPAEDKEDTLKKEGDEEGKRGGKAKATPIGYHELAELSAVDERLLRARLSRGTTTSSSSSCSSSRNATTTRVALLPDIDAILWHLMREDFMTKHIFGRTPTVRGAVVGEPGRRVWAVWTRGYYGGLKRPEEGNTMHILRLVVEGDDGGDSNDSNRKDDDDDDAYVREALQELMAVARAEAAEWRVNNIELWNPEPRIRRLVGEAGVPFEFVERETDSIASLMFYGDGEVEWVLNEKFGWC